MDRETAARLTLPAMARHISPVTATDRIDPAKATDRLPTILSHRTADRRAMITHPRELTALRRLTGIQAGLNSRWTTRSTT
jgi:hypothetical protein